MKEEKREKRRRQKEKLKKRARRLFSDWGPTSQDWAAKHVDNLAVCSGPCCGNPRRHFKDKLTIQEKKSNLVMQSVSTGLASTEDIELLDWEARSPLPPPRRAGTVKVRLIYAGRVAKPRRGQAG